MFHMVLKAFRWRGSMAKHLRAFRY
uniref:Uncharacterized protein n=1 Tax=Tetranychus urticae TaxID=32264 RepID=T1KNS5_TETUR